MQNPLFFQKTIDISAKTEYNCIIHDKGVSDSNIADAFFIFYKGVYYEHCNGSLRLVGFQ